LALAVLLAVLFGRPVFLLVRAYLNDRPAPDAAEPGFTDDASRLNRTPVREVWDVPVDPAVAERELADLLRRARRDGLKVSVAGARHSMGGHTIAPEGVVVNMLTFDRVEFDDGARLLRVGAGARWSKVVPYLDHRGLSVAVMQSNNDFTVGGSLSVNCHGWQHDSPSIASTVELFRLMMADGRVVRCSRRENAELFSLALGGYGLFGVILDAELRVVPNARYSADAEVLTAGRVAAGFREKAAAGAGMAYGRLCVVPGESFLREAILTTFLSSPCPPGEVPPLEAVGYEGIRRAVFRAQMGSAAGKELRWDAERRLAARVGGRLVSRNQLLNGSAEVYREHNADRTDVLQEYFVPEDRFAEFLDRARIIIPKRPRADLLNVTVRKVLEDRDTVLRYADRSMFALVMLFNQERSADADAEVGELTRELVEAALVCGGRYYLPYRLQPTREQFLRAYPGAGEFFAKKRQYDPDELFSNQFYAKYGR
jgi:FAD/FMN-containing dehydrogenase